MKYVVWGQEAGRIVARDGNMAQVLITGWNVTLWIRIEELSPA